MLIRYTGSSRNVWKRYSVGMVLTYRRNAVLSVVRSNTSSRQSPMMSPCRHGLDLVPLLLVAPSKVTSGVQVSTLMTFLSSISRSKSPSHHTAMFIGSFFTLGATTSPFILRMPSERADHISTPCWVGSMSAAMQRPTSVLCGNWKMTFPVAASLNVEPSFLFS